MAGRRMRSNAIDPTAMEGRRGRVVDCDGDQVVAQRTSCAGFQVQMPMRYSAFGGVATGRLQSHERELRNLLEANRMEDVEDKCRMDVQSAESL